jgi:hypothetical protein
LGAFADGVFAAEFGGDYQLAFGGYGGDFGFHCASFWENAIREVYLGGESKSNVELPYIVGPGHKTKTKSAGLKTPLRNGRLWRRG